LIRPLDASTRTPSPLKPSHEPHCSLPTKANPQKNKINIRRENSSGSDMAGFGAKTSSAVGAEGKTLSPDLKQTAAGEARTPRGLLTPESTPGPDTARLETDKARRQAEVAKAVVVTTPASPPGADTTGVTVDIGRGPVEPTKTSVPPNPSPDGTSDEGQRGYADEQKKKAVNRVLKCAPNKYYQILGVKFPQEDL